jgi:energy-coupling factor transporter ATP-binding protein EcfA2
MSEVIELPTKQVAAKSQSPKNLIIFSKPKVGKTTLMAALPNCLLLDLEEGSDYLSALKIKADSVTKIRAIGDAIKKAGYPYKYIAIDTGTALEDMCIPYAEQIYASTSMGSTWFATGKAKHGSLLNMPNGAGYPYLREAFSRVLAFIGTLAPYTIILAHVKDTVLDRNGSEFAVQDLDLTGKIKRITASRSDAIGYLYRNGSENILTFKTTDEVSCGARPEHLRNKEIVISEEVEGKIVTHWDKIFID